MLDEHGHFLSKPQLEQKYQTTIDQMQYNSILSAIPKTWKKLIKDKPTENFEKNEEITVRVNDRVQSPSNLNCRDYYWHFVQKMKTRPRSYSKWEENYPHIDFNWENINSVPYICARETSLQSLQYRLIHRYLPCRYMLNIWYNNECAMCSLCNEDKLDTLEHFFVNCGSLQHFWQSFHEWWSGATGMHINLGTLDILFGILNAYNDKMLDALNFSLIFAKHQIYTAKIDNTLPEFDQYKDCLRKRLTTEQYILNTKGQNTVFLDTWNEIFASLQV